MKNFDADREDNIGEKKQEQEVYKENDDDYDMICTNTCG